MLNVNLEDLKQLRTIFTAKQFVVGGSLALKWIGFETCPKDVDIFLTGATEDTVKKLKEFEESFPVTNKSSYKKDNHYQFMYNGVKYDFFVINFDFDEKLTYNGFIINKVDRIIEAKKSYQSDKHMVQLLRLRNQVITDTEFNKFVSSNCYG